MAVYLNGNEVEESQALDSAAELLNRANLPLLAGLMTDVAGAEAAVTLAEEIGGVVDHASGGGLARANRLMREAGSTPVSLGELRNRSDLVIVLGKKPFEADPDLLDKIFPGKKGLPRPGAAPRRLVTLGAKPKKLPDAIEAKVIETRKTDLATAIGMLAAATRKHPFGDTGKALPKELADAAEMFREAAFSVFVYSPEELDEPVLHVVLDMIRSLCDKNRSGLYTVPVRGNGDGVNLCSVWTCGLPMRTSFAHGDPVNDAWRFDANRMIESGEADALVWIDAFGEGKTDAPKGLPTIALAVPGAVKPDAADIVIEVAKPGVDHDAALYLAEISGLGMVKAKAGGSGLPTVADVLRALSDRLKTTEAA
ncbi:Formyltransferase/hydrolase complex Fhc subunit B [Methyloligella halotolerans]|uniref:Formyltransferase/hydrolase complex Fhc subunit B n=1 Tax=Methyloligella halotolerans TaxID=1177755 RepID=A0A1E2S378_9HYPH|nr:hypothetical protein [Methyloligella halotolerans]ODA68785.1 Formyltransferase/hydrolase complex Fhc subunit B [Methyloligella halotolerans]